MARKGKSRTKRIVSNYHRSCMSWGKDLDTEITNTLKDRRFRRSAGLGHVTFRRLIQQYGNICFRNGAQAGKEIARRQVAEGRRIY